MSKIKDNNLINDGISAIQWAKDNMPILKRIRKKFQKEKPFVGINIGVSMHLDSKTAVFLKTLQAGGADISASSCNPLSTDDGVAAALSENMEIFAWSNETDEEYYNCLESVIRTVPKITLDDGGDLLYRMHFKFPALLKNFIGGCEETSTGSIRLKAMKEKNELKVPVIDLNNAYSKYLFDNRYGSGQSVIEGIVSATNILIAGKTIVIVGYGRVGRGLATRFRGMGARVIVVETTGLLNNKGKSGYHKGLEALYDGNWVSSMEDASNEGDIFITATGSKDVISKHHIKDMKDNAILANAGHFDHEIDVVSLKNMSKSQEQVSPNLVRYKLKNGKSILLLSEGRLVNLSRPTAHGHPIEIMDGSFSLHALCVEYLVKSNSNILSENSFKIPDVYSVPNNIDEMVARYALEENGIILKSSTFEQKEYLKKADLGT